MLHRLAELDAHGARRPTRTSTTSASSPRSTQFMTADLSAFYFDIRKDALYCDPISSADAARPASPCSTSCSAATVTWLAPMLLLHRRGGLARALSGRRRLRASRALPRGARRPGATRRWPRSGARCAACAASSPARSRSSARKSASAPRSRRRRWSMSPTRTCSRALVDVDLAEICDHLGARPWSKARVRRTPSASTTCAASRSRCGSPRAANARARGRSCRASAPIPHYPDVSPRDAQALREWDALRKAAE